jgi:hypothetical protein
MEPTFPPLPPPPPPPDRWWPPPVSPLPPQQVPDRLAAAIEPPPLPVRETKAVTSLTLGILCLVGTVCGMGLSLGIPAIILGAMAHRDLRAAGRSAKGGGYATAGIILGTVGSTVFFGWVGLVAYSMLSPSPVLAARAPVVPVAAAPAPVSASAGQGPRGSVVELHHAAGALRAQLISQTSSAARAGENVLVETSVGSCEPCTEIERAVTDPAVLSALAKVRLLRIDVGEFRSELAGLRMNEPTVPWFYLLDARGQPRDAISADEWDDNIAENIAPVLGAFVHGRLQPRRTTWRGRTTL